ncbi:MAG: hypothetical protein AB4063_00430 [Crocosphaera sp.]
MTNFYKQDFGWWFEKQAIALNCHDLNSIDLFLKTFLLRLSRH